MLKTGSWSSAARPSSSLSACVRTPTAATWRPSTRAVSRSDSPRPSCVSPGRRTIGWPPISTIPASKLTRVRVDGFWKTSATVRPSSRLARARRELERGGAVEDRVQVVGVSSVPVRRWRMGSRGIIGRDARPDLEPLPRPLGPRRARARCCPSSRTCSPAGSGTSRCCRRSRRGGRSRWRAACGAEARAVLTSRNALLPLRRAIAERRPDLIKSNGGGANAILVRRRGHARHATRRAAPLARAARRARRAARRRGCGSATSTRRRTPTRARGRTWRARGDGAGALGRRRGRRCSAATSTSPPRACRASPTSAGTGSTASWPAAWTVATPPRALDRAAALGPRPGADRGRTLRGR